VHADEVAPHEPVFETGGKKNKTWYVRVYAFFSIGFSFVAGMKAQETIERFRVGKSYDNWPVDGLLIAVWLVFSIFWGKRAIAISRDITSSASSNQ